MKTVKTAFIFIILPMFIAGCLQVETTVKVNNNGSGTINEKVLFSKAFIDMIREFSQSFNDSASAETEDFSFFKVDEIKADAMNYGENVLYVSHELIKSDKWEGYQAVYSFDDITKIKLDPDPDSKVSIGEEGDKPSTEEEHYFFKFVGGDNPELIIDRPEIELTSEIEEETASEEAEQSDEEMEDEFLKMMEGMKISIAVEVDGSIVSTNASYVEGSKVTLFEMDLGEMMKNKEAFKEFKKKEPKNIEEMKEFLEKFPGMKIEVEKPISIKFN